MPSEDTKTLEFNQYHKCDKTSFIIYPDLKSLTVKIDGFKKNPEKLSPTKVNEHNSIRFFNVDNIVTETHRNKHNA